MDVQKEHVIGTDQIETNTSGSEGQEHDTFVQIELLVELFDDFITFSQLDFAIDLAKANLFGSQELANEFEHRCPLRDHDDLVLWVFVQYLGHHVDESLEFCAGPGLVETLTQIDVFWFDIAEIGLEGCLIGRVAQGHVLHESVQAVRFEFDVLQEGLVDAFVEETHVAASLSQTQQIDENFRDKATARVLAQKTLLQEVVDFLLGLIENHFVDFLLVVIQRKLDRLDVLLRQIDNLLLGSFDLIRFGTTQDEVAGQETKPIVHTILSLNSVLLRHGFRIELLGRKYILPKWEFAKRFEMEKLDQGIKVQERVVNGSTGDGDAVFGA